MNNKIKRNLIITATVILCTGLIGFGIYYFALPVFNFHNAGFFIFCSVILAIIVALVCVWNKNRVVVLFEKVRSIKANVKIKGAKNVVENKEITEPTIAVVSFVSVVGFAVVFSLLMGLFGTPLFNAKKYAHQLEITDHTEEFNNDFAYNGDILLPIFDKDLAFVAASGKLSSYGSQYSINKDNFTILSVERENGAELVRVTPLEYSGVFVALNQKDSGSIGYIEVNVITKETKLVKVDGGMKYMPSGVFKYDLDRHIRFKYPSALYTEKFFEIDDEGNPYWIIPTYTNEIALFSGAMPTGTIIVNPVNGDINRYEIGEEPLWVDRVVVTSLAESQAINALKYKNGFFNTVFGAKRDVFTVSDGYNYFIKNGRTYYVSCITSPNEQDQTSVGFVTIDLKTREAKKYNIPGITEMRAREIAMLHEEVKAQQLEATWPILINYKGVPTYFLVLKNEVQDCKVVFLDVETGRMIAMGTTLEEARNNYDKILNKTSINENDVKTVTGKVNKLQVFMYDIYFMIDTITDKYFIVDSKLSLDAMFLEVGNNVSVKYVEHDEYNLVKEIKVI